MGLQQGGGPSAGSAHDGQWPPPPPPPSSHNSPASHGTSPSAPPWDQAWGEEWEQQPRLPKPKKKNRASARRRLERQG
eukprot:2389462-Alexandrium_andersonii.AAC.1